MYTVDMDYLEAINVIAGLEERLKFLVQKQRHLATDDHYNRMLFPELIRQTARVLAKVRIAAHLDEDQAWTMRKVIFDAEQAVDYLAGVTA